ncbi:unnamed protein product [Phyllotreta striolata]|uniref:Uncharacterized protein n=1 Tax=Phyllotreta striolata TaxID=444603 RepID=A0A9N9XTB9_PHYSR|nr:unnamed protein product [Phyllotreta striolata]
MQNKSQIPHKKICLTAFIVSCLILSIFYYDETLLHASIPYAAFITWDARNQTSFTEKTQLNTTTSTPSTTITIDSNTTAASITFKETSTASVESSSTATTASKSKYLVSSAKCKIPDFQPFNKEARRFYKKRKYQSCSSKKRLTSVTVADRNATLFVEDSVVPSYSSSGVKCCYSYVTRAPNPKDPDGKIKLSQCKNFDSNVTVTSDPVYVKCLDSKTGRKTYENVHSFILIDDKVRAKLNKTSNTAEPMGVLLVGVDSISRLNFVRSLPKSHAFVERHGWIPLKGYNKIDDNTYPNLMGILTGFNNTRAYAVCQPTVVGKLDACPLLWYDFAEAGYVTAYAEDEGAINTFNYRKKGFVRPPVDYYYRPYVLATEKLKKVSKDGMTYCTGAETAGERILKVAEEFAVRFRGYPNFGLFWMNSFSHNDLNSPSGMDDRLAEFLDSLTKSGVTNTSLVIFFSDHGIRFGPIRKTLTGWLEERLPFIYVSFPPAFSRLHRREHANFVSNVHRLTSPYDLHLTLRHVLELGGAPGGRGAEGCPTCRSLFEPAAGDRSCAEAGIAQHWCTCSDFRESRVSGKAAAALADFALKAIRGIVGASSEGRLCADFAARKVVNVRLSTGDGGGRKFAVFHVETEPMAVFESTVSYVGDVAAARFTLSGDISRLDRYNEHSQCVRDAYLKKYCYCRGGGSR